MTNWPVVFFNAHQDGLCFNLDPSNPKNKQPRNAYPGSPKMASLSLCKTWVPQPTGSVPAPAQQQGTGLAAPW